MDNYNILREAEMIISNPMVTDETLTNVHNTPGVITNDEVENTWTEMQELAKSLENIHWEALVEENHERASLIKQKVMGKPRFDYSELRRNNGQESFDKKLEFIISGKLWIREVKWLV